MTLNTQLKTVDNIDEYKNYILKIITRLHNENSFTLKETTRENGKLLFKLEFRAPEWFRELSDEVQEVAFDNLKRIMVEKISNFTSELGYVEHEDMCHCCEDTDNTLMC